jgi:hypothetical protein
MCRTDMGHTNSALTSLRNLVWPTRIWHGQWPYYNHTKVGPYQMCPQNRNGPTKCASIPLIMTHLNLNLYQYKPRTPHDNLNLNKCKPIWHKSHCCAHNPLRGSTTQRKLTTQDSPKGFKDNTHTSATRHPRLPTPPHRKWRCIIQNHCCG